MDKYKHYILVDDQGRIVDGWSDGPHKDRDTQGATLLRDDGGYQFRLGKDGGENQPLVMQGVPLYKWTGKAIKKRTQKEIDADLAALQEQAEAQREAAVLSGWKQDNMRVLAHLVDTGVIGEGELKDKVQAMTDAPTDEVEWIPGTWYEAGATVYTVAGKYLVTRPHMAQAHYPPGSEGVHNYAPLPKIVDDYPEYEPGMIVWTGLVVRDMEQTQLYECILPNLTPEDKYICIFPPNEINATVWRKYEGD